MITQRRRRLPSWLQECQWIEFTGTQYIDTGFSPTNHYTEISYQIDTYVNDAHIIGTDVSGGSYYHISTYSNKYYWGLNGSQANAGSFSTGKHLFKYNYGDNRQVIIDSTVLGSGNTISVSSSYNLLIGRRSGTTNFKGKFFYIKSTNRSNNTLIRDYIPCYAKSAGIGYKGGTSYSVASGTIGMYDLVNNRFYINSGSGTFTKGPDIRYLPEDATALKIRRLPSWVDEYKAIYSWSTGYINTGIVPTPRDVIKFKISLDSCTYADRCVFGTQNSASIYAGNGISIVSGIPSWEHYKLLIGGSQIDLSFGLYEIEINNGYVTINGSTRTYSQTPSYVYNYPIYLYNGCQGGSRTDSQADTTMYYFSLERDGELLCNLVTAKTNKAGIGWNGDTPVSVAAGVSGFYDTVSKKFRVNSGSYTFSASGVVPTISAVTYQDQSADYFSIGNNNIFTKAGCLPPEFQRVSYIESTGTQYIDTGIKGNSTYNIEFDAQLTEAQSSRGLYGTINADTAQRCEMYLYSGSSFEGNAFEYGYGAAYSYYMVSQDTNRHLFKQYANVAYLDSTAVNTFTTQTFDWSSTFYLFNMNRPTLLDGAKARGFGAKISNGTVDFCNYIPCYIKQAGYGFKGNTKVAVQAGEIGMYDLVNDKFQVNAGTGTFLKGSDLPNNVLFLEGVTSSLVGSWVGSYTDTWNSTEPATISINDLLNITHFRYSQGGVWERGGSARSSKRIDFSRYSKLKILVSSAYIGVAFNAGITISLSATDSTSGFHNNKSVVWANNQSSATATNKLIEIDVSNETSPQYIFFRVPTTGTGTSSGYRTELHISKIWLE